MKLRILVIQSQNFELIPYNFYTQGRYSGCFYYHYLIFLTISGSLCFSLFFNYSALYRSCKTFNLSSAYLYRWLTRLVSYDLLPPLISFRQTNGRTLVSSGFPDVRTPLETSHPVFWVLYTTLTCRNILVNIGSKRRTPGN